MKMAFNHVSGITQDIYDQPEVRVLSATLESSVAQNISSFMWRDFSTALLMLICQMVDTKMWKLLNFSFKPLGFKRKKLCFSHWLIEDASLSAHTSVGGEGSSPFPFIISYHFHPTLPARSSRLCMVLPTPHVFTTILWGRSAETVTGPRSLSFVSK